MQPQSMHDGIRKDGQTRQITRIFQKTENQVKGNDIGQDHGERYIEAAGKKTKGLDKINVAFNQRPDQNVMEKTVTFKRTLNPVNTGTQNFSNKGSKT